MARESTTQSQGGMTGTISLAMPYSCSAWIAPDTIGSAYTVFDTYNGGQYRALYVSDAGAVGIQLWNSTNWVEEWSAGGVVAEDGAWKHIAITYASITSRIVYVDGSAVITNTTSFVTDFTAVNLRVAGGASANSIDGDFAEAAIWTTALTADEIGALARRVPTRSIRPQSLYRYWPMLGDTSPEPDYSPNGSSLSITGGSWSKSNHVPIALGRRFAA